MGLRPAEIWWMLKVGRSREATLAVASLRCSPVLEAKRKTLDTARTSQTGTVVGGAYTPPKLRQVVTEDSSVNLAAFSAGTRT